MSAHILVVEPETALQAALSSWLEWEGYDCACASDPEEALAIAEHDRADVALVSDHAAAWDACGLAGELKSLREDLAIIVLCGAGRRRCRVERSLDVIEEIPAPITRGAVTQAVTRAVRWREAPAQDRQACLAFQDAMVRRAADLREACRQMADDDVVVGVKSPVGALMERRNPGAVAHALRVTEMARLLGSVLNLTPRALTALERAAFLHDLGKAALPDELLAETDAADRSRNRAAAPSSADRARHPLPRCRCSKTPRRSCCPRRSASTDAAIRAGSRRSKFR